MTAMGRGENRDERGAEVKEKNNDHQADNDRLFQQVVLQRLNGIVDQPGTVVARNDFHAGRKRALDVGDFLLEAR